MNEIDEDEWFWRENVKRAETVGQAIVEHAREESPITRALDPFQARIRNALKSVRILGVNADHDWLTDGMTLARTMYDAHLQALYILVDPNVAKDRAQLFLDYRWIEQHRLQQLIDTNETGWAKQLKASPRRSKGEAERQANFDKLRPQYLTRGGSLRKDWYEGNLTAVARALGREHEFNFLQRQLSGAVHSMPTHLLTGGVFRKPQHLELVGWTLMFRILGGIASHFGVPLGTDEQRRIAEAQRCLFDVPN